MKKIKHKLLILIMLSNTILFLVITIAVNILTPRSYIRDAERALLREREVFADDTSNGYYPTYLSGSISYMFIDKNGRLYLDGNDIYNGLKQYRNKLDAERKEISEFCAENEMSDGECCIYKTSNAQYVITSVEKQISENDMVLIMYINIKPFLNHIHTLDLIIFLLYICVSVLMSIIGLKLGSIIDTARESEKKFFQNSSHELKTPLMSIQGYAEGIQMKVNEPVQAASVILRESERMAKLVDELLYISRIDANQLELHIQEIDIHEIIYDCIRYAEPLAEKKPCIITPKFGGFPEYVNCDEEQLTRAISNIIVNAVYHCNSEVSVSCCKVERKIVIAVYNDGEHIPQDILPYMFDRFRTGRKGGSGVGLSIAKEVINLHHGKIHYENISEGVECVIQLPE